MVSKRPVAWAMSALVPTPSVDGHQHRPAVAVLRELEQATEPADVADDLGPEGGADLVLDALDRLLARGDVDSGAFVRLAHAGQAPLSVSSAASAASPWMLSSNVEG